MIYCFPYVLLLVGCLLGAQVFAQPDTLSKKEATTSRKSLFSIGAGLQHGFIFAHSQAVENTKGSHPTGIEATASWQRTDSSIWALCNCFPRRGVLLAYYDYDNPVLGKSITAAYFLEPTYRIGKKTFFSFKGAAGLSYLTNPFDSIKNPSNQSYSTTISGYLLVGVGAWFRINERWWINPSVNYQHISNGGMREPNKGINYPTAGLAVSYQPVPRSYFTGKRPTTKFWKEEPLRFDITPFGTARRNVDATGQSRRMGLLGLAVQGAKQVGRINMLTAGMEASWDEELKTNLKRDSLQASPTLVGLLVGHEFLLGRFLFTQRLGFYLFDQTPYYDALYHRWTISYRPGKRLGFGFSLKAHRHIADYMDFRLSYYLGERLVDR
jgi:hypothetical protein